MSFLLQYLIATITFLGIDIVWLTVIAKNFYSKHLGYLMSPNPNLFIALLFYLINIIGMVLLVISPSIKEGSIGKIVLYAAVYGLCTYATYDLTNLSTIKDWPVIVTVIDLLWGTFLTVTVSLITFLVYTKVLAR